MFLPRFSQYLYSTTCDACHSDDHIGYPACHDTPIGTHSNFDDPTSEAQNVYIICSICLGLATPLVVLRIYTRVRIAKPLWWDDSSVLSWIFLTTFIKCMFLMVDHGGGIDVWNVPKVEYTEFTKYWKMSMAIARLTVTLAKLAILLLFLRLFEPHKTGRKQLWFWLWFMIFFNIIYCVIYMLLVQLQCIHRKKSADGSCVNEHLLLMTASLINVITEIALLLVPIFVVRGLRIPTAKKIGIIAILSFGTAGIALALARLIWQSSTPNRNPTIYDMTILRLAIGEITIAIMTGCLPILPAFYKFHFQRRENDIITCSSSAKGSANARNNFKSTVPTKLVLFDVQLKDMERN